MNEAFEKWHLNYCGLGWSKHHSYEGDDIKAAFLAGAEWQKEQTGYGGDLVQAALEEARQHSCCDTCCVVTKCERVAQAIESAATERQEGIK